MKTPTYENALAQTKKSNIAIPSTQTDANLSTLAVQQEGQAVKSLDQFSQGLNRLSQQVRDQVNRTVVLDSLNQAQSAITELTVGEKGYTSLKGKQVVTGKESLTDEYAMSLTEKLEGIAEGMSIEQRRQFHERSAPLLTRFKGKLSAYTYQENKAYQTEVFNSNIKSSFLFAGENSDNPEGLQAIYTDTVANINERASIDGWSNQRLKSELKAYTGTYYGRAIAERLKLEDFDSAEEYYKKNKSNMDGNNSIKIRDMIVAAKENKVNFDSSRDITNRVYNNRYPSPEKRVMGALNLEGEEHKEVIDKLLIQENGNVFNAFTAVIAGPKATATAKEQAKKQGGNWLKYINKDTISKANSALVDYRDAKGKPDISREESIENEERAFAENLGIAVEDLTTRQKKNIINAVDRGLSAGNRAVQDRNRKDFEQAKEIFYANGENPSSIPEEIWFSLSEDQEQYFFRSSAKVGGNGLTVSDNKHYEYMGYLNDPKRLAQMSNADIDLWFRNGYIKESEALSAKKRKLADTKNSPRISHEDTGLTLFKNGLIPEDEYYSKEYSPETQKLVMMFTNEVDEVIEAEAKISGSSSIGDIRKAEITNKAILNAVEYKESAGYQFWKKDTVTTVPASEVDPDKAGQYGQTVKDKFIPFVQLPPVFKALVNFHSKGTVNLDNNSQKLAEIWVAIGELDAQDFKDLDNATKDKIIMNIKRLLRNKS